MKKIMILGASSLQLPAIEKARDLGLETIVVDINPCAVGFGVPNVKKEIISTIDDEAVLKAARSHNIDGIMTLATDMPMRTVAKISREMKLIGISEETALKATDKIEMRNALAEYNVPIPKYFAVKTEIEFCNAVDVLIRQGYKCIAKPSDNSGSRGVVLLTSIKREELRKSFHYCKKYSRSGNIIVEEFMEGDEVSVEAVCVNGECNILQITDKLTTGFPNFVEMGHSQPSLLPIKIKEKIRQITIDSCEALGIENGPAHVEVKVTNDGPKIVELGARMGGDNITSHLVPISTGVDMIKACIDISLGINPIISIEEMSSVAIRYLRTNLGTIKRIEGVNEAMLSEGVCLLGINRSVGDVIDEIKSSNDRFCFAIAKADTVQNAIKLCDDSLKKIKVELCQ